LQLGVFRFDLLVAGNIGISVFPQCQKILIGGARACAVAGQNTGATKAQKRP
jgi:hypothetical protein